MPDQSNFPPAPTVGQANQSLRAQARDTAWWIRQWTKQLPAVPAYDGQRRSMLQAADNLDNAVRISNDALDREAFGRPASGEGD